MKKILLMLLLMLTPLCAAVVDKIVATVNGEPVTLSELDRLLQPVYKQYEQVYKGEELEECKRRARHELLEQLIENKLIVQKAKKEGLSITEAVLEEELADVKDKFGSMEEFEKALGKEGLTLEQYKKDLAEQITIKAMIEREIVPKAKINPEEIEAYYNEHRDEFIRPKMVQIGHILIKNDEKNIQDIYKQLGEGKDFSILAEQYSEAGDPGFIPIEQLKPELREIVDSLKVGEYSKIIKTDIGWHIIQLKGFKEPEGIELSAAWEDVDDKLFRKKLSQLHKQWIIDLKSKAHIVIEE